MFQDRPTITESTTKRIVDLLSTNLSQEDLQLLNENSEFLCVVVNEALAKVYDMQDADNDLPMPTQLTEIIEEKPRKSRIKRRSSFSGGGAKGNVGLIRMHYEALFRANYPEKTPAKGNLGNIRSIISMAGSVEKTRDYFAWVFSNWKSVASSVSQDPSIPPTLFVIANYEKLWHLFEASLSKEAVDSYPDRRSSLMHELERLEAMDND